MTMVKPKTYGRMGNFLFQAATAMAYAWDHGLEYTLPNHTNDPKMHPVYLQHLVNPKWNPRTPYVVLREKSHAFRPLEFREQWRGKANIILDGYWQTEKYFKHHRERILKEFGFAWEPGHQQVSIHIRRGDYLVLKHKHPEVTVEWYEKAMSVFSDHRFVFYSDDISWCKQTFGHRSDVTFSLGKNEVEDMNSMSHCAHHICSASTFSWWGAWLNRNPNKRVIMPKQWFMPGHGGLDTSDIVPLEWERV